MLADLAKTGLAGDAAAIYSTYVKADRSSHGGKRMARFVRKWLMIPWSEQSA